MILVTGGTGYIGSHTCVELQEKGFTIGAHSNYHPEFWQISEEQQKKEITSSIDWIIKHLNPKVKAFAFPFTDSGVERSVMISLLEKDICDISFGTAGIKNDELNNHFQRYPVENSFDFLGDLKSELIYYQLRKFIGKATVRH